MTSQFHGDEKDDLFIPVTCNLSESVTFSVPIPNKKVANPMMDPWKNGMFRYIYPHFFRKHKLNVGYILPQIYKLIMWVNIPVPVSSNGSRTAQWVDVFVKGFLTIPKDPITFSDDDWDV